MAKRNHTKTAWRRGATKPTKQYLFFAQDHPSANKLDSPPEAESWRSRRASPEAHGTGSDSPACVGVLQERLGVAWPLQRQETTPAGATIRFQSTLHHAHYLMGSCAARSLDSEVWHGSSRRLTPHAHSSALVLVLLLLLRQLLQMLKLLKLDLAIGERAR